MIRNCLEMWVDNKNIRYTCITVGASVNPGGLVLRSVQKSRKGSRFATTWLLIIPKANSNAVDSRILDSIR